MINVKSSPRSNDNHLFSPISYMPLARPAVLGRECSSFLFAQRLAHILPEMNTSGGVVPSFDGGGTTTWRVIVSLTRPAANCVTASRCELGESEGPSEVTYCSITLQRHRRALPFGQGIPPTSFARRRHFNVKPAEKATVDQEEDVGMCKRWKSTWRRW
jgi:hypothetical protein